MLLAQVQSNRGVHSGKRDTLGCRTLYSKQCSDARDQVDALWLPVDWFVDQLFSRLDSYQSKLGQLRHHLELAEHHLEVGLLKASRLQALRLIVGVFGFHLAGRRDFCHFEASWGLKVVFIAQSGHCRDSKQCRSSRWPKGQCTSIWACQVLTYPQWAWNRTTSLKAEAVESSHTQAVWWRCCSRWARTDWPLFSQQLSKFLLFLGNRDPSVEVSSWKSFVQDSYSCQLGTFGDVLDAKFDLSPHHICADFHAVFSQLSFKTFHQCLTR